MYDMKKITPLIPLIVLTLLLCCSSQKETPAADRQQPAPFIIWSHSDIQPKREKQLVNFSRVIDDISSNIGEIDIAITAGDIVEKKNSADIYRSYLEIRKRLRVCGWFTIAGNHEWRNISAYREFIDPSLYYSVRTGNMLIIFLSNSEKGRMTVIPDHIFEWWKRKVIENQDKIIITVTHASLENSGLLQSKFSISRQFIKDSEKFEEVLKKYRVDLWISGHSHLPGFLPYTDYKNDKLNGTLFIDNGAIRKDTFSGMESRLIYFYRGTNRILIRHREHESAKFSSMSEKEYLLSKIIDIPAGCSVEIDDTAR